MLHALEPLTVQRITVITDETVEKLIVERAIELGADSYICSYCSGKPLHLAFERTASSPLLVRIELLAKAEEAEAIMECISQLQARNHPVMAIVDPVKVCV